MSARTTGTAGGRRARLWTGRLLLAAIGAGGAASVCEWALRAFNVERLPFTNPALYEEYGDLVYRMRGNVREYSHGAWFETNEYGLRGPAFEEVRARGKEPVMFVGDSVVVGFGVTFEETLVGQYERLNDRGWVGVSVATAGYNAQQEWNLATVQVEMMRPKAGVWMLVGNDFDEPYPIFEQRIDGSGGGALEPLKRLLRRRSVLYAFARKRWRAILDSRAGHVGPADQSAHRWIDGSKQSETNWGFLRNAIGDLKSRLGPAAPLIVCTFPFGIPAQAHERLEAVVRQAGATWLDLRPLWADQASYLRDGSLGWDGHPNAAAHARMAARIAEAIEEAVGEIERGE